MVGGLSYVQFVKYEDKTFGIRQAAIVPTVTDYADGKKQFKIQFLKDYSDENSKNMELKSLSTVSLKDFKEIPRDVLGNWYKD